MEAQRIQLFHNQYRHIVYFPDSKRLVTYWFGEVPEEEQLRFLDYLQEAIKIYEIDHFEVNTKKVKSISLSPMRQFMERVLTKAYQQGAKSLTMIQKSINNEAFVLNAYVNALRSYGIRMKFQIVAG